MRSHLVRPLAHPRAIRQPDIPSVQVPLGTLDYICAVSKRYTPSARAKRNDKRRAHTKPSRLRGLTGRSPRLPETHSFGQDRGLMASKPTTTKRLPPSLIAQRRTPSLSRTLPVTTAIGTSPSAVCPPAGPIAEEEASAVCPPAAICPSTEAIGTSTCSSLRARQREGRWGRIRSKRS
jgi:hypothetical protein